MRRLRRGFGDATRRRAIVAHQPHLIVAGAWARARRPALAFALLVSQAMICVPWGLVDAQAALRTLTPAGRAMLERAVDRSRRDVRGVLGVGIELLESHETMLVNARERFPMQSVYKLAIAMAVLRRVDRRELSLQQSVEITEADLVPPGVFSPLRDANPRGARLSLREVIRLAVAESDGSASDVLIRISGGVAPITAFLEDVGVKEVIVATTEKEMGGDQRAQFRSWMTPRGGLGLLRAVYGSTALSDSSRRLLLGHMIATTRGAERLRGLLPPGTAVAHKPGSSGAFRGVAAATNDVGIITLPDGRHLAVVVLLANAQGNDASRDRAIARIGRAAYDAFVSTGTRVPHAPR